MTYNMVYDADGRLYQVKRGTTLETTYNYNAATAQLSSVADAAGTTVFTYNQFGQIWKINDPLDTTANLTVYTYDPTIGRLTGRADAQAALTWSLAYEPNTGRLDTEVVKKTGTSTVLSSFELDYDAAGNVAKTVQMVAGNAANGTWTCAYDGANRMIQAVGPSASGTSITRDYRYDGAGNRIYVKEGSTEVTTTYDGAGLPTSSTDGTTYAHDQVGDLTSIDRSGTTNDWSYGYDPYGRMTCAKKSTLPCSGTGAITFKLDALDRLVSRTGSATSYTWSGLTENPAKIVAGATTTYAYARSGSPLGQKVVSGKTTTLGFYLSDPHGDVVGMAAAGAVTGSRSYDPWGKPLAATGSSSSLGFQGDLTDSDTGQVDMGARYYEPTLGRFSSRDVLFGELTNPVSLNQYVYGADSPLTFSDPTGMMWAVPHTSGCAAGDASCLAAVDWADAWFAAHPLPAPVSEPMPFDPGHFRTWTNNHAAAIRYASDYFDVPRSVIAGVLATEHQLDKRSRLKALGETGAFGLCGGAGTSQGLAELCAEVSFGAGQIQLRRAQALDSAVRQAVQAFYGTGAWDYSDMGILSRLEDENTNILYVAAFMDSLRAGAPAGSHWGEIYEGLGNTSPVENYQPPAATRFVSGFAASENYYLYLDRDPMWGADRSGLNFEISPIYDFNPVAPLWNPWTS